MKILIIGANGQLGSDLGLAGERLGHEIVPCRGRKELDVTDSQQVNAAMEQHRPDAVINTAARCDVDACETDTQRAYEVNAVGARSVAEAAQNAGARLVHVSTDYVFSGEKGSPYVESDAPDPVNVYGTSKLAGEHFVRDGCENHLVVRSSGLFGVAGSREKGGNFIETMVSLSAERSELRGVSDQFLSPTYTLDLAAAIISLLETDVRGLVHVCNQGACSWLKWSTEIFRLLERQGTIEPVSMDEFGSNARRPRHSALESEVLLQTGLAPLPPWEDAVRRYLEEAGHLP